MDVTYCRDRPGARCHPNVAARRSGCPASDVVHGAPDGLSYGTRLGAENAEMFPKRVRAFVLDAALEHSPPDVAMVADEITSTVDVFDRFADWCRTTPRCAPYGQDVGRIYDEIVNATPPSDGRTRPPPDDPGSKETDDKAAALRVLVTHVNIFAMQYQPAYDAIVVGARCAGSPIAMLLARHGHRVLLTDRATFPSDTVSTHVIHPPGVAALRHWGLLDRLTRTRCPPIHTYTFDFGPITIAGAPGTHDSPVAYAPRRIVLDKILLDAASSAGADVREAFTVEEVVVDGGKVVGVRGRDRGGRFVTERATVVVGADGVHSTVARTVRPQQYRKRPGLICGYTYWSGLPVEGRFEIYNRPRRGWAACPTHDDLTLVVGGWPYAEFAAGRTDVEGTFQQMFEQVPAFAERLRGARREERFVGTAVPNYVRKPYGPGWALVGGAGHNTDFITAQEITDAFRDAELCAGALHAAFTGIRTFDAAMAGYQVARDDRVLPMYEMTAPIAALEPPPPDMVRLLAAMRGNQQAMDAFARVNAGVTAPSEFFAEENVRRILAAAIRPEPEPDITS